MRTLLKHCAGVLFILLLPAYLRAQITLTLQQPPPYQFKLEHLWKVTLMNPTKTTFTVYMVGRATERKDGRIVEATTAQFPLPPGLKIVGSRELQPLDVKESNTRYSDVVKQIGSVPTGDYDICVTVYDALTHAVLGEMCVQSLVQNLTQVQLLSPGDGAVFSTSVERTEAEQSGADDEWEMGVFHDLFQPLRVLLASIPKDMDPRTAIWGLAQAALRIRCVIRKDDTENPAEWAINNWPEWDEYMSAWGGTNSCRMRSAKQRLIDSAAVEEEARRVFDTAEDSGAILFNAQALSDQLRNEILQLKDPAGFLQALQESKDPHVLLRLLIFRAVANMGPLVPTAAIEKSSPRIQWRCWYCTACKETHCVPVIVNEPEKPGQNWRMSGGGATSETNATPLPGGIMIFSWFPPAPIPPQSRFTYSLKITEIIGRQSPYDAFHSNPAALVLPNIATNMVQLPLAARRLRPGVRYAWGIDVYLNNALIQSSEVWSFALQEDQETGESQVVRNSPDGKGAQGKDRPIKPGGSSMLDRGPDERTFPSSFELRENAATDAVFPSTFRSQLFASILTDPEFLRGPFSADPFQFPLPEPFVFAGMLRIDARHASRVGSYSEMPRNSLTADIRPGMVLYGLPFESYLQYSTLQDSSRQSMNSFGINFNFDGFRQGLESRYQDLASASPNFSSLGYEQYSDMADPRKLAGNLDQYGAISGAEKLFMSIRSLGIGTNYPSYSEYILSGVPVTGVNVELNPGMFYSAFTASRNQRPIDNAAYLRDLYAGRLGVGAKEGDHLHVSGLYAADDGASIRLNPANLTLTPRENYVLGMEGRLNLFGDALAFEAEGAASLFTRDTRDPEFASSSIPTFVRNLTNPRLSSSVDYMYSGRLVYSNPVSATKISAGVKMIGPGYASLGVPQLRTDQFGYEAKFDQQFFSRRVTFGSFFRMYNDNLIDWKSSTTTMTAYGINLGLNIPLLPYLRVSFSPIMQKNDASDPLYAFRNTMLMVTAMAGYSYSIASLGASTSFSYAGQRTETGSTLTDYQTNSFMITQMQSFSFPLTIGLNLGFIESKNMLGYGMIQTVDLSGSAPLGEMVTVGLGVTLAFDRSRNERLGVYADGGIRVIDGIDASVRLEKTNYNDFLLANDMYREFLASLGVVARW